MKTVVLFTVCAIVVLSSAVFYSEAPESQKFDGGYVQQANPDCWKEPSACLSSSMYPAGY